MDGEQPERDNSQPDANYEQQPIMLAGFQAPAEQSKDGAEEHSGKDSQTAKPLRQRIGKWFQKAGKPMGVFTFVIVLATVSQVAVGWLQWNATNGQLEVMRQQTQLMTDQLKQANEAAAQAKAALDASIENSRNDQRAWITVGVGKSAPNLSKNGAPIFVSMTMINSGKTPAINLDGYIFVQYLRRNVTPDFAYAPDDMPSAVRRRRRPRWHFSVHDGLFAPHETPGEAEFAVIDPLQAQPEDMSLMSTVHITPEVVRDLTAINGKYWIAVHGKITYDDIFGIHHWVTFCWDGMRTKFADLEVGRACAERNYTDRNKMTQ